MLDAIDGSGRTERSDLDSDKARKRAEQERDAALAQLGALYASGARSTPEMQKLRESLRRMGMPNDAIDRALEETADPSPTAETTASGRTSLHHRQAHAVQPWMLPMGAGRSDDRARYDALASLPPVAADRGAPAHSVASYVESVDRGRVAYARLVGVSADDVRSFVATGTLPDKLDAAGNVVASGSDRLNALEGQAHAGSWPAANMLVHLIDARRAALAAERADLESKARAGAPIDRAALEKTIADGVAADRELLALRHRTHAEVSEATARFATSELHAAQKAEHQAAQLRKAGRDDEAAKLESKARDHRAHAAKVAYGDAKFRAGSPALGLRAEGSFATAAEAQIAEGRAQVERAKRGAKEGASLPASAPAVLGDDDGSHTGNGVPGAARLIDEGKRGGLTGHPLLALETKRHAAIADFHKAHIDGARAARVAAAPEHRAAYIAERGEQAKALVQRERLYSAHGPKNADDALEAGRVDEQMRDVLTELADIADRGATVRSTLASTRSQLRDAEVALASAKKERAAEDKAALGAEENVQSAAGDASPLFGNIGRSEGRKTRAREGLDDAITLSSDAYARAHEAHARVTFLAFETKALAAQGKTLEAQVGDADVDSQTARDVLARILPNAGGSPRGAALAARDEADRAAASQKQTLDKLETSKPSEAVRAEIARQRTGLAGYYARAAEARGASGAAGYIDQAHAELSRADALRATLAVGDTRDALTLQSVDVRSDLAAIEVAKQPGDAVADLAVAAKAAGDIRSGVVASDARARVGGAAVTSLLRLEHAMASEGAKKDRLYAQGHRMLDPMDARDPAVAFAKKQLDRVDDALAAVARIIAASGAQTDRGAAVARAYVRTSGRAQAAQERGSISSVIQYGAYTQSLGRVDLRGAIDDAEDGAIAHRFARIDKDAHSTRERIEMLGDAWQAGVREGRPFETLERMRDLVDPGRGDGSIGDDAPLLRALREPVTSFSTIAERYASPNHAAFSSGARGAMKDADESLARTQRTAAPLGAASFVGEVALASATGGAGLVGEIGAGLRMTLAAGGAMASASYVARKAFGSDSEGAELVELAAGMVPLFGGGGAASKSLAASVKHVAMAGGEALAVSFATEHAADALHIESEEGRAAFGVLMSLGPGGLRAASAIRTRLCERFRPTEAVQARIGLELETFVQKTRGQLPTAAEVAALKDSLYKLLGVSVSRPETAKLRASIDADVEALAYARPLQRSLAEMAARVETLTPEQVTDLTKRIVDQLVRARGLSISAARAEAVRVLRPVVALAAAATVPVLVAAMESEAGAAVRPESVSEFKAARSMSHGARDVLARLLTEAQRNPTERTNRIRLALAVTHESAARIEAHLQGTELELLKGASQALGRGAELTAEQSAALERLREEVRAADAGATQRTPSGKHWASVDLTFEEYAAYYAKMGGPPKANAELRSEFDAGKRLNPETANVVSIVGRAVYATATDVLPLSDMAPADRAAVEKALAHRTTIEAQLRALEADPNATKKQIDNKRNELNIASDALGQAGADAYVRTRFAGPPEPKMLWPVGDAKSQPGDFDRVWEVTTKSGPMILVVEAKGNGSQLGERNVDVGGVRGKVDQGTRHYAEDIIANMRWNFGPEAKKVAKRIEAAKDDRKLLYIEARTTTDPRVQSREFDLSVNTGLRKR